MSSKRTLVKQKVTYGSVGDGNLHESDDDFSDKRSPTKRVSFGSHELSDSDSDEENSQGRINRSSAGPAGDSLDGLFRESSSKERTGSAEFIKGTSEKQASKDKYSQREDKGQPRPAPRPRPTIQARRSHFEGHSVTTSHQSSDEDGEDMSAVTWPIKAKEAKDRHPVPPPRTSPRQHQEKSPSPDMVSPRPVPRSRPTLSPREGKLKLFKQDSDGHQYERTKHLERDSGGRGYEKTEIAPGKPVAPLRRKKTQEETHENRTRPQIPTIRTSTFEDDGPFLDENDISKIEQDGNLRQGQLKKVKGRPVISVARSGSSEESEDDVGEVNRTGFFGNKRNYKEEKSHDREFRDPKEQSEVASEPPKPSPRSRVMTDNSMKRRVQSEEEDNHVMRPGSAPRNRMIDENSMKGHVQSDEEDNHVKRPGSAPRSHMMADNSMKRHVQSDQQDNHVMRPGSAPRSHMIDDNSMKRQSDQQDNHVKRPGSAPSMKKASSLETLQSRQSSSTKKALSGPKEEGAQRVQLKKSLTPQRPISAKKGSFMTKLKAQPDITDTFEEHVPSTENIIETPDERGFRKKGASAFDAGGGRSGPLKANQAISTMTRSPHPREAHTDLWTDTTSASRGGTLTPKRSSSMTNLRGISPETLSESGSSRESQHGGLMDTASIRQAVYDEWRAKKSARSKEQMASKSAEKKKLEDKEQEERERKKLAKRAFESWNEQKHEQNKEKNAKKRELMEKELEKRKEKNLKARDAKKYFESWKSQKDEVLKEQHQQKREEQRNKKKKEEEEKQEKSVNAQKVFENWKKNKDEKIKEELKKKKKDEKDKTLKEEDETYERSIQCAEHYQAWVENKGKPRRGPPPPTLTQRSWCPSGRKSNNCIPEKVGSVIQAPSPNRSRTMSGSYYFKTNKF